MLAQPPIQRSNVIEDSPLRYWHTIRHLRPVQIYGRAWFRAYRPRPDLRPAPGRRSARGVWSAPAERAPSMVGARSFVFLNERANIEGAAQWNGASKDKLWLYNLHYFDDLTAARAPARKDWHKALISRWIAENAPGQGNGWEPYPLSLRLVNWIKWARAGNEMHRDYLQSLAVQARWMSRRLEWHLLGNHLFANAKALIFAGVFFDGDEAENWRGKGLAILTRELPEQILADGGHFELSPMYHAIILEDLLDLINLANAYPGTIPNATTAFWRDTAQRMRRWLAAMVHPDGEISFFNDAAIGIARPRHEIESYARRLGLAKLDDTADIVTSLRHSGYTRVALGEMVALLDTGAVGPDYLPGHAHADTLSFEASFFGRRVIVNSGTSLYGTGPERLRQRSTAAHNTVEIDAENSSEVWGGFRVARRARPFDVRIENDNSCIAVSCSHDGYRRLAGRVMVRRCWTFHERSILVTDTLGGGFDRGVARLHLHPAVTIEDAGDVLKLHLAGGQTITLRVRGGQPKIRAATWHREFGLSIPNKVIEIGFEGAALTTELSW